MMMIVVLDESGTHKDSRAIAVAGFVIAENQTEPLEEEWNEILSRAGGPPFTNQKYRVPHPSRFCEGWDVEPFAQPAL
jgi:hypothetical protein